MRNPQDVYRLHDVNDLLVEGGSATATAFLTEDLVDRILIYRAPIIVGEGKSSFGYVGLDAIADAHGRWRLVDEQRLGVDRLEVYERVRGSLSARAMFTGIVTDVGTVRSAEQRGDLRLRDRHRLRPRHRRSRRLDRLFGRLPDRRRQGRRLVRGRRFGRDDLARPPPIIGAKAQGSTSSARFASATSLAAISSPAMSMPSARWSASAPKAIRPGSASASRGDLGADDRRQGLDHARRRVADRQRSSRRGRRNAPISRSTSSRTRRSTRPWASSSAGQQLNVEVDVLARYIDRMLAARAQ